MGIHRRSFKSALTVDRGYQSLAIKPWRFFPLSPFYHSSSRQTSRQELESSSMGFLDKAKSAFKDLEGQLDKVSKVAHEAGLSSSQQKEVSELQSDLHIVNAQAAKLGIHNTSASTSASATPVATPASSIAPKKMATKLPLAIRKEG